MSQIMRRFMEAVADLPLFEQASRRRDILAELRSKDLQLAMHLLKIIGLADNRDREHWKTECISFILRGATMRDKKLRYLKEADYKHALFDTFFEPLQLGVENVGLFMRRIRNEYPGIPRNGKSDEALYDELTKVYGRLCEVIAASGASKVDSIFGSL